MDYYLNYLNEDLDMTDRYTDNITVLETNIDDSTGEMLGYVSEKLFSAGARDVFYTSIYMKKKQTCV